MKIKHHLVGRLKNCIIEALRKLYQKNKRSRLKNKCPTIISRNCIGGIIYHDLGLRFTSPTINLSMTHSDYLTFLENLEEFILGKTNLHEGLSSNRDYPVGELVTGNLSIRIDFIHYKSFEEAKEKWYERAKRVDLDNLYIIWDVADENGPEIDLWNRFKSIRYKNKLLITGNKCNIENNYIVRTGIYGKHYHYGKLLEFRKGVFCYKRYLDSVDYVKFLNAGYE